MERIGYILDDRIHIDMINDDDEICQKADMTLSS